MKSYYGILGLTNDAEAIVIRAAYRALVQHYHPDRWKGDLAEATNRMSELNEAFDILSDPDKRKQYDSEQNQSTFTPDPSSERDSSSTSSDIDEKWRIACDYYPDLSAVTQELKLLSTSLAFTYKLTLLETRGFEQRKELATEIEKAYLTKYFGSNFRIRNYAKTLIKSGRKDAARELNKVVCVLGNSIDDKSIKIKIEEKFPWTAPKTVQAELIKILQQDPVYSEQLQPLVDEFSKMLGIPIIVVFESRKVGWLNIDVPTPKFNLVLANGSTEMSQSEFQNWVETAV